MPSSGTDHTWYHWYGEKAEFFNCPTGVNGKTIQDLRDDPHTLWGIFDTYAPSKDALVQVQKAHWGLCLLSEGRPVPWFQLPPPVDDN